MNWIIPPLQEEIGEFVRVCKTFGIRLSSLISLFHNGTIGCIDEETWSKLGNTDSWKTVKLEQVFKKAEHYGRGRNAHILLNAFRADKPMEIPIVLFFTDGRTHLVSGNTRLMICRAIGKCPKIFKLYYKV